MSTIKSIEKEVGELKKENAKIKKRLTSIEKNIGVETPQKETSKTSSKKSDNSIGNILMIIVGAILCATFVGAIIGIPLIIWAVVRIANENDAKGSSKTKKSKPSTNRSPIKTVKPKSRPKKVTKNKSSIEENIGVKWFARIGILALVIGVGFFIKYAIEMNWISHLTRIILGVILGVALIILGEFFTKKKKYDHWAKTLIGGGIAIIYFVIYAAYHFPTYRAAIGISQGLDITLLALVVIFAIFISLKENSKIIVTESFLLGYVTSLLSTNFDLITVIYTLLLTFGLVIVVSYKKWPIIGIGGVLISYLVYSILSGENTSTFALSSLVLISYFIAFNVQSFFLSKNAKVIGQNIAITLVNAFLFTITFYNELEQYYPQFVGLFLTILSIYYFTFYLLKKNTKDPLFTKVYLSLAIFFISLAVPVELNGEWVTIVWALEAVLLTYLFVRTKNNILMVFSFLVGAVTFLKTLFYDTTVLHKLDLVNLLNSTRLFSFVITIISFYIIYDLLTKNKSLLNKDFEKAPLVYSWSAAFFMVLILFIELVGDYTFTATILLLTMFITFLYLSRNNRQEFFQQSIGIAIIIFLKTLFITSSSLDKLNFSNFLSSTRLFAFALVILCFYLANYFLKYKQPSPVNTFLTSIAAILTLQIIYIELIRNNAIWVTILYSIFALTLLLSSRAANKNLIVQAFIIQIITVLKLLFFDTRYLDSFSMSNIFASSRVVAFVVVIASLYLSSWYFENKKPKSQENQIANLYSYAASGLAFILIILEMQEFWISVGWSILALIITLSGFIFRKKHLRLQGLLIFAVTIFKVFIYDTRSLETIYRTVSYIVLGIILLAVSFIYTKYKDKLKEII